MAKHRLYIDSTIIVGNEIHLRMDRMHYIMNVLRLTIDDSLIIFDGSGHEYFDTRGMITFTPNSVVF